MEYQSVNKQPRLKNSMTHYFQKSSIIVVALYFVCFIWLIGLKSISSLKLSSVQVHNKKQQLNLSLVRGRFSCDINHQSRNSKLVLELANNGESISSSNLKWYSPKYSPEEIDFWWKQVNRPFLTIGSKGISSSHINSLNELIGHHEKIRIRLAHSKINAHEISASLISSPNLNFPIEALQIREREILIGKLPKS